MVAVVTAFSRVAVSVHRAFHCGEETRNLLAEWCRDITIGSSDIWSTGHPG
jgi:hypothetical protein